MHHHWPLNYARRRADVVIFAVLIAALLLCLSWRRVAIAPSLLLSVLPSTRISPRKRIMSAVVIAMMLVLMTL
jgi:hypothetical protein